MKGIRNRLAIEELVASFFWKIDRRETHDIATLFTEDGQLFLPDLATRMTTTIEVRGHEALTKQWANRPPNLVSRHVYTNLQVHKISDRRAEGRFIGIGFRTTEPGFGLPVPVVVADHDDVYERGSDGQWRFREKRITPVFVAPALFDVERKTGD